MSENRSDHSQRPYSLRRRLSLGLLTGLLAAGVVVAGCLYVYLAHRLTAAFDRTLVEQGRLLAAMIDQEAESEGRHWEFELTDSSRPELSMKVAPERRGYFMILEPDGSMLARSESLRSGNAGMTLHPQVVAEPPPGQVRFAVRDMTLPEDIDGRALTLRFWPDVEHEDAEDHADDHAADHPVVTAGGTTGVMTLVLATSRHSLDQTLAGILFGLVGGGVLLAAAGVAIVWFTLRRALRPVGQWAATVGQIDPTDPAPHQAGLALAPRELLPVSNKLDDLLQRMAGTLARERRFTNDIAHELRTPLAEVRAMVEVALMRGRAEPDMTRTLTDVAAASIQMTRLVNTLLSLRRAGGDPAASTVISEEVEISTLLRNAVDRVKHRRNQTRSWRVEAPPALRVRTDPALLLTAIDNLLCNAAAHASGVGDVLVTLTGTAEGLVVLVSNPAEGLDADFLEHGCDPFWRADPARGNDHHFGLGLTLIQESCRRIGGNLSFAVHEGRLEARLDWPNLGAE